MNSGQTPTGRTHLEVFDWLHGASMDLQFVFPVPAFQQLLISEFKSHLLVWCDVDRGLKLLQGPPYRAATHTINIVPPHPTPHLACVRAL